MSYKTILVHVDESKHLDKRVEVAAKIAAHENAHLIGVAATRLSEGIPGAGPAAPKGKGYRRNCWPGKAPASSLRWACRRWYTAGFSALMHSKAWSATSSAFAAFTLSGTASSEWWSPAATPRGRNGSQRCEPLARRGNKPLQSWVTTPTHADTAHWQSLTPSSGSLRACDHRRQQLTSHRIENARSQWNSHRVIDKGKPEVFTHVTHCRGR